jgi:hypothetical protein
MRKAKWLLILEVMILWFIRRMTTTTTILATSPWTTTCDATGNDTVATGGAATGGAASSPGTTNFNLRVEQNKIPEFFSTKSKDTILAADFIRRLEDLAKTNQWTDAQTYYHFAN